MYITDAGQDAHVNWPFSGPSYIGSAVRLCLGDRFEQLLGKGAVVSPEQKRADWFPASRPSGH